MSGLRSSINQSASGNNALSKAQEKEKEEKSKVRARVEQVLGAKQKSEGGRIVRKIGIVREKEKIGLQKIVYKISGLVKLERMAAE